LCQVTGDLDKGLTAFDLKSRLAAQGILVRYYNTPLLKDYIRISIGLPEQNDALLAVLQGIIKEVA
jgi:histidinol-phosphate aminotransferase